MKSKRLIALVAMSVIGCGGSSDETVFTREDRELLRRMAFSPRKTLPIDEGNDVYNLGSQRYRDALAVFGQQLFFDTGLSSARPDGGGVSCAECHAPADWFSDPRQDNQVSYGLDWTGRNSPSLVNVGQYVWFGWDGRADMLWAQSKVAFEAGATMNGSPLHLAQQVARRYSDVYWPLFGSLPMALSTGDEVISEDQLRPIYKNILKAWSAYMLQLNSGDAPFDAFANGDEEALTLAQRRGLHLFIGKAGCINCHKGPHFTDNEFHALGLEQKGAHVQIEDLGRYTGLVNFAKLEPRDPRDGGEPGFRSQPAPANGESEKGKFRTKSLRQVAQTGPYFHAGQMATLDDVVWFYNQGGLGSPTGQVSPFLVPLGLTESEQSDLVAFLGSLTGSPVPAAWACNNARTEGGVGPRCGTSP